MANDNRWNTRRISDDQLETILAAVKALTERVDRLQASWDRHEPTLRLIETRAARLERVKDQVLVGVGIAAVISAGTFVLFAIWVQFKNSL